jgi:hypothetical protein
LLQDGDVGVGIFPEGEEILVGGERPDAGGVGIRSLEVLDCKALARATPRCANDPVQQFQTMPLWSMIFWNSAAAALPWPAANSHISISLGGYDVGRLYHLVAT